MPGEARSERRVSRRELLTYEAHGLVVVEPGVPPTEEDMRRIRRIRRLRKDLGLSYDAIVIVLRLLDRLEAAERGRARTDGRAAIRITVVGH
jgi:DNA-binding transcriptional MerR regulator